MTAQAGPTSAVLRYVPYPHDFDTRPHLRIAGGGRQVFAELVPFHPPPA